jgi:hypothetical protein
MSATKVLSSDESSIDVDYPDFEKNENNTSFLGISFSDRFRDIAYTSRQFVEVNVSSSCTRWPNFMSQCELVFEISH